jgi:hypothetical protein
MYRHRKISRRTVLRGTSAVIGLPLLEAMIPTRGLAAAKARPQPLRTAFLFVPNGANMADWNIAEPGPLKKLSPILEPLNDHRQDLLLLRGLALNGGRALGDGAGDHARCVASFLTGAHPLKTGGNDIRNGTSIDQLIAAKVGNQTRLPSLELGCEQNRQGGSCDSGYSCSYSSNMSWRNATSPVAKEINPKSAFERLFGGSMDAAQRAAQAQRDKDRRSILDFVAEDAKALQRKLGKADQRKLDEYLFAIRQLEQQLDKTDESGSGKKEIADYPRPAGIPREFDEHVKLMMDIMTLAMQTDSTRVLTFMYGNAGSNRSYAQIGVPSGHHSLSHHGNDAKKLAALGKINHYHVTQLKYFLDKLKNTPDGEGTLLDNSLIVYGSGLSDPNRHSHHDLPVLLAGRAGGSLDTGRNVTFPSDTPLTNLYVNIAQRMGADVDSFSDSSGSLEGLS